MITAPRHSNPYSHVDPTGHVTCSVDFCVPVGEGVTIYDDRGGIASGVDSRSYEMNHITRSSVVVESDDATGAGEPGETPDVGSAEHYTATLYGLGDVFDYAATFATAGAVFGSAGPTPDDIGWIGGAVILEGAAFTSNVVACVVGCMFGGTAASRGEAREVLLARAGLQASFSLISGGVRMGGERWARSAAYTDLGGAALNEAIARWDASLTYEAYGSGR